MIISVLTLFPELYEPFIKASLIGRAQEKNIVQFDIRSYFTLVEPKERVDSPTFGHHAGMLLRPSIIQKGVELFEEKYGVAYKIFFSPHGKKIQQRLLEKITKKIEKKNHVLLLPGRYEGMDARVEEHYADEVLSIGDFVVMGGDIPAMLFIEGMLRLIPDVIKSTESVQRESFSGPFVDYPEYTAPIVWQEKAVPTVLRSGNHQAIERWRQQEAVQRTVTYHFDWLRSHTLKSEEKELVRVYIPPHYSVLMHDSVYLPGGRVGTTSVTSIDIHDIARAVCTYGLKNYFIVTSLCDQQKIIRTLLEFWRYGPGQEYNKHRYQALSKVQIKSSLSEVIEAITLDEDKKPVLIATAAKLHQHEQQITYCDQEKVWSRKQPVVFVFGTGHGLSNELIAQCDFLLQPLQGLSDFNHLSVRSAAAIIFDRWMGFKSCL